MRVIIGCEASGVVRRAFRARGHDAWSCDLRPAADASPHHLQCDVRTVLDRGYHQKVKPGTLVGAARREARQAATDFVFGLRDCGIPRIAIENPGRGALSRAWRPANQIVQPYEFGDDASKGTGLWLVNLPALTIDPARRKAGRKVIDPRTKKVVERWSNQTDGGQNKLPPSPNRWSERSESYPGMAAAWADQWGSFNLYEGEPGNPAAPNLPPSRELHAIPAENLEGPERGPGHADQFGGAACA